MLEREQWQKGSRLREDGEQWAGRLAGTLGGAFQGTFGPHGRGYSTTACSLSDYQHTERFL